MFDVKKVEEEARAEVAKEAAERAKGKIKDSLKKIAAAKAVVVNLEAEHEILLKTIGE